MAKLVLALSLLASALGLFNDATFQRTTTAPLSAWLAGMSITINSTIPEPDPEPTRSPPVGKDFYIAAPTVDARNFAKVTSWSSHTDCPEYSFSTFQQGQGSCIPYKTFVGQNGDKRVTCLRPGSASSNWTIESWSGTKECEGSPSRVVSGAGTGCVDLSSFGYSGSVKVDCRGGPGKAEFHSYLRLNATTEEGWIFENSLRAVVTGPDGSTKSASCTSDAEYGPNAYRCRFSFYSWDRPGSYRVTQVTIGNNYGTMTTYSGSELPASLAFNLLANADTTPPHVSDARVTLWSSGGGDKTTIREYDNSWGYSRSHDYVKFSFKATDDLSGVAGVTATFTVQHERDIPRVIELSADNYRTTGDARNGEYQYSFSSIFLIPGRWLLRSLWVVDHAGNNATFGLADIIARQGSPVMEATGAALRFPKRASLLAAGITPYIDVRSSYSGSISFNMTLEGAFNASTEINAECTYRNGDTLLVTQLNSPTRSTDENGNTVLRASTWIYNSDQPPGTYRLMGCVVETKEFGVVRTSVYGELTESQKRHYDRFTYSASAAPALTATLPFLGLLAALAAALAAAF